MSIRSLKPMLPPATQCFRHNYDAPKRRWGHGRGSLGHQLRLAVFEEGTHGKLRIRCKIHLPCERQVGSPTWNKKTLELIRTKPPPFTFLVGYLFHICHPIMLHYFWCYKEFLWFLSCIIFFGGTFFFPQKKQMVPKKLWAFNGSPHGLALQIREIQPGRAG